MKPNRKRHERGQALVEFGLVLPVLLLLTLLILDFSRAMIGYTSSSSALRRAVRLAEVIGYEADTPVYLDCERMLAEAQTGYFVDWSDTISDDIEIYFVNHETGTEMDCTSATENTIANGDMLVIDMTGSVPLLNPFVNEWLPAFNFNFVGQRTVVKNIELNGNVENDKDFDGLLDDWEITYFGNTDAIGTEDPDNDGCNNGCEETRGTNPLLFDTDGDGLSDGDEAYIYKTDGTNPDTDGDGLLDGDEIANSTDPFNGDSDGDGLLDGEEVNRWNTDPNKVDTDGDTLSDYDEVVVGYDIYGDGSVILDPLSLKADSDDDGLRDDEEVLGYDVDGDGVVDYYSDPLLADGDGDGLSDVEERAGFPSASPDGGTYYSDPLKADADDDGLNDSEEKAFGTDPNNADIDNDGLTDSRERELGTDPFSYDTDGDGLYDGDEVDRYGTDPLVFDEDADLDGIPDAWEESYFAPSLAPDIDPQADPDNDGCNNLCEFQNGVRPDTTDTDGDGVNDGDEIYGYSVTGYDEIFITDPRIPDTDGDGLKDGEEQAGVSVNGNIVFTNPTLSDTDGDTLSDGDEVNGILNSAGLFISDPTMTDTDGDGLTDSAEVNVHKTNPSAADTDGDGLTDSEELFTYYTSPRNPDTDGDGLTDSEEVNGVTLTSNVNGSTAERTYTSNPNVADTDNDGISDGDELDATTGAAYITDPANPDTDGDSISDANEINGVDGNGASRTPTDPTQRDTDGDTINDAAEFSSSNGYVTDPTKADTDGDGFRDDNELANGTNPLDPLDPNADADNDGLHDPWELRYFPSITSYDGTADPDNDGCSNECEETNGTNPLNADTDGDGINDGNEINGTALAVAGFTGRLNPLSADTDGDGLSDGDELSYSPPTDPTKPTPYITINDGNGTGMVTEPICTSSCTELVTVTFTVTLHNDYAGRTDEIIVDYRTLDSVDGLPIGVTSEQPPTATGSTFKSNDPGAIAQQNDFKGTDDRLSVYTVSFRPIAAGEPVPAERTERIRVTVYSDKEAEGTELFYIELYNATNAAIVDKFGRLEIHEATS